MTDNITIAIPMLKNTAENRKALQTIAENISSANLSIVAAKCDKYGKEGINKKLEKGLKWI